MLVSSLLRTFTSAEIVVLKNTEEPLFMVARAGVEEVFVEVKKDSHEDIRHEACRWKYLARHVFDGSDYERILFIDADCVALRNVDHLFDGQFDVAFQPEPELVTYQEFNAYLTEDEMDTLTYPGVNSGTFVVNGEHYNQLMKDWEEVQAGEALRTFRFHEQAAWNRVLLDTNLRKAPLERGSVKFPLNHNLDFRSYRNAAIIHAQGGDSEEKRKLLFAMYMQNFYDDISGTYLSLLEI